MNCPKCGQFTVTRTAEVNLRTGYGQEQRELLSAAIRYRRMSSEVVLTSTDLDTILKAPPLPKDPLEAMNNLIEFLGERQRDFASFVPVVDDRFLITVARNAPEFAFIKSLLKDSGYAEDGSGPTFLSDQEMRLTIKGWARLAELRASRTISNQAFVAMWFAEEMASAWTDGFYPALEENGYSPRRVDKLQHNDKIDDRIIAEIRRSGLLVADFTGQRGGVYFEAGFARGLGLPVIWTCRADAVDKLHFDTRQYNHIVWKSPADLREQLSLRIQATLPRLESRVPA